MKAKLSVDAKEDILRKALRTMPIDQRADFIVQIFRIITSEWAAMVLESVKPPKAKPKRR